MKTYDVHFNNNTDSNSKGFKKSIKYCKNYIKNHKDSYFADYKNGTISIVCNDTGKTVYEKISIRY